MVHHMTDLSKKSVKISLKNLAKNTPINIKIIEDQDKLKEDSCDRIVTD